MTKAYSINTVRNGIKNFKLEENEGIYPEWNENGKCTWDIPEEGYCNLTEKDHMKMIEEGLLSYSMLEDLYVPATILDNDTQEWLF